MYMHVHCMIMAVRSHTRMYMCMINGIISGYMYDQSISTQDRYYNQMHLYLHCMISCIIHCIAAIHVYVYDHMSSFQDTRVYDHAVSCHNHVFWNDPLVTFDHNTDIEMTCDHYVSWNDDMWSYNDLWSYMYPEMEPLDTIVMWFRNILEWSPLTTFDHNSNPVMTWSCIYPHVIP